MTGWTAGNFYSGWAPFNAEKVSVSVDKTVSRRAGVALGRAVFRKERRYRS